MEKRYLFTPGPTPVPPEVLAASAEPMVHHRGADFRIVYERTLVRLQEVFCTRSPVLLFSASGTGAMDSAVSNLTAPGDRVAVVVAGAFGERWAKICTHYGLDVQRIDYEWGEVPDPDEVGSAVAESGAEIVFCTQSETSTGVVTDIQAFKIGRAHV
jgi:serine---pyruvate transaminase